MGCLNSKSPGGGAKSAMVVPVVSSIAGSAVAKDDASIHGTNSINKPVPHSSSLFSSCASYPHMKVRLRFMCLDEFVSKYTTEKMCKWRPAEIAGIAPSAKNSIVVHFDGWNSDNDITLNLDDYKDYIRVAPIGLLSDSQLASGTKLTQKQEKAVVAYIARHEEHFEIPFGCGSRRNSKVKNLISPSGGAAADTTDRSIVSTNDNPVAGVKSADSSAKSAAHQKDKSTPENKLFVFEVGDAVDIQDEYKTTAVNPNSTTLAKKQSMSKLPWRPAVVQDISLDKVRVHYVGWGNEWDEVIDISTSVGRSRICKGNQKTSLQNGGWSQFDSMAAQTPGSGIHINGHGNVSASGGKNRKVARRRKSQDNEKMANGADIDAHLYRNPSFYRVETGDPNTTNTVTGSDFLDSIPLSEVIGSPEANQGSNLDAQHSKRSLDRQFSVNDGVVGAGAGTGKKKLPKSPYQHRRSVAKRPDGPVGESPAAEGDQAPVVVTNGAALSRHSRRSFPGPGRISSKEVSFEAKLAQLGMHVIEIVGDGNCLFRAVAHQMYLDQEKHVELRASCCAHMLKHRQRFEAFCSDNFDSYIKHLSNDGVWGDHLEIKALEEIFDRIIIIYEAEGTKITPMNYVNVEEQEALNGKSTSSYTTMKRDLEIEPILLSYHGRVHYNSIFNEKWNLPLPARHSTIITKIRINSQ